MRHRHTPESYGTILDELAGNVRCAECRRYGRYSTGRRKIGRPARIHWYSEQYSQEIDSRISASAGEAGTAETPQSGSVHEHAVPEGETP